MSYFVFIAYGVERRDFDQQDRVGISTEVPSYIHVQAWRDVGYRMQMKVEENNERDGGWAD